MTVSSLPLQVVIFSSLSYFRLWLFHHHTSGCNYFITTQVISGCDCFIITTLQAVTVSSLPLQAVTVSSLPLFMLWLFHHHTSVCDFHHYHFRLWLFHHHTSSFRLWLFHHYHTSGCDCFTITTLQAVTVSSLPLFMLWLFHHHTSGCDYLITTQVVSGCHCFIIITLHAVTVSSLPLFMLWLFHHYHTSGCDCFIIITLQAVTGSLHINCAPGQFNR